MGPLFYDRLFGQVQIKCYNECIQTKFPYFCTLLKLNDQARCRKTVVLESKL
jgi:hypothetical protein